MPTLCFELRLSKKMPLGCVQANTTSGISTIADELMREEVSFLTSIVTALRAVGESPQCPYMNLGEVLPASWAHRISSPLLFACPNCWSSILMLDVFHNELVTTRPKTILAAADSSFEDATRNAVSAPSFLARAYDRSSDSGIVTNVRSFLKNPTFDSRADDSSFLAGIHLLANCLAAQRYP